MQIFQYGPAEIDHLKRSDKKLGRVIDCIGMIERQVMASMADGTQRPAGAIAGHSWTSFQESHGVDSL